MVAWPLYAEQNMNRVILVDELKLALPLNQLENDFVSATELEKQMTELMSYKKGKALRDRVTTVRDGAKAAMKEGGSSLGTLAKLIESITRSPVS